MASQARVTAQKRAIQSAFKAATRPLTVQEVHARAQGECTRLGLATVYRAVNRLVVSQWLSEVNLPGHPTRYERRALAHHHHFHCHSCDRVLDVSAPCQELASCIPKGFQVDRHELTFYGTCADCAEAMSPPRV